MAQAKTIQLSLLAPPDVSAEALTGEGAYRQSDPVSTEPSRRATTNDEFIRCFCTYLEGVGKSPHTVTSFKGDVSALSAAFKPRLLTALTRQDIAEYLADRRAGRTSDDISDITIYRRFCSFRSFFGWMFLEKYIEENPTDGMKLRKPRVDPQPVLTMSETDRFETASEANPMERLVTILLLGCGLKKNELLRIAPEDINTSNASAPFVAVTKELGNKQISRQVPLPVDFVDWYRRHLESLTSCGNNGPADRLFSLTDRSLSYLLAKIARRAGFDKSVSSQTLRDTFAVRMLCSGATMDQVIEALGLTKGEWDDDIRTKYETLVKKGR